MAKPINSAWPRSVIVAQDKTGSKWCDLTELPECDEYEGDEAGLRAAGYAGLIPKAGYSADVNTGIGRRETIRASRHDGSICWTKYLHGHELVARREFWDAMSPPDDSRSYAAWFHDDRRKAVAAALSEIANLGRQSKSKHSTKMMEVAEAAVKVLLDRNFSIEALSSAMRSGELVHG